MSSPNKSTIKNKKPMLIPSAPLAANPMLGAVNSIMRKGIYKAVDLFGSEEIRFVEKKQAKPNLFNQYDDFLDKFEDKKTTDDCYTPPEAFEIILNYVKEKCGIYGCEIIRPFFTDGNYEDIDYPENCIVIDNPPFSIITQIAKFYIARNIKFFLFSPHLTAFSSNIDCTHIIASADITYENGATIKTAFLSNLFGDNKIIGDAELCKKFKELQAANKANLPKYQYPDNILTVSKVAYCVEKGISITIDKNETKHYRGMDAQKIHKKAIFGSGFIVSDKAAAAAAAAAAQKNDNVIVWELSDKEKKIIESLGGS